LVWNHAVFWVRCAGVKSEKINPILRPMGGNSHLGSGINSNRLVFQKSYPDSSGESDRVTYTYNRQSEALTRTDQAGTLHTYTRDKLGRLLADLVTFPSGTALDTTVGRLTTGYNERGLVVRSTSRNPAGNVVINEVRAAYNDFNQLHTEWQEHNGAVNLSTSRKVQYAYENGASNTIRPTTLTSPGGSAVTTAYQSETADALSRPDQIRENSAVLASMEFLGLATPVGLDYEAASHARLTMKDGGTGGDAKDIYTGLDRFGRLVETLWKTGSATLVRTKYGRNRVGGVVWQRNVKAHESSAATQDQYYWYDGLQQVTRHDRGDLVPSSGGPYTGIDPATRQQREFFRFDETGNFRRAYSQNPALSQSRSHDSANQITAISGPVGVVQPAYDPAGNMTLMPSTRDWTEGDELVWDAWNRLVRVRPAGSSSSSSSSSSGSSSSSSSESSSSESSSSYPSSESSSSYSSSESGRSSSDSEGHSSSGNYHFASSSSGEPRGEVTYQYDALTRRTRKTNSGGTIDYYYDKQWRAIEEWTGGSVDAHYVWSPLDRWTMIRRKRGGEELYVLKDYLDPAAIIDTGGNVVERFGYDAFGPARFMAPDFSPRPSSAADWNFLFHAEFLDEDTGLYNYGYRWYDPVTGRWPSRDPIEEQGGINLYGFVGNDGINWVDLLGLAVVQYHHWLMQAGSLDGRAESICNGINIHRYTTPYPPDHNRKGTPHHFIHYVALGQPYQLAYMGVLEAAERLPKHKCCALLLGVEMLKNASHELLRKHTTYTLSSRAELWSHPSKGTPVRTDSEWLRRMARACCKVPRDELKELAIKVTGHIKVTIQIPFMPPVSPARPLPPPSYPPVPPELYRDLFAMPGIALGFGGAVGTSAGLMSAGAVSGGAKAIGGASAMGRLARPILAPSSAPIRRVPAFP
jgi:RHS repeat-associated protein